MHKFGDNMRFNEIKNREQLADFLKIKKSSLSYILYKLDPEKKYHSFQIPKKNGEMRNIDSPTNMLKDIQKRLSFALNTYYDNVCKENDIKRNVSTAFEKKKGIYDNARRHVNKKYVVSVDIKNFFPSFNFGRILNYFQKNKYFCLPYNVAVCISQLVCYNGYLPQGAPTSPLISNLIFQIVDSHIIKIAKEYKLTYTRYADDLTFSTNNRDFPNHLDSFIKQLTSQLQKDGFEINPLKTRISYCNSKQKVTGLVVNKKVSIDSDYNSKLRGMLHRLYCTGKIIENDKEFTPSLNVLEGKLSYIDWIEKINNSKSEQKGEKKTIHDFYHLTKREKEVQKFLFYKYFIANKQPVLITEGKTDILYIKAALKKFYQDYPSLVEKKGEKYIYKISFFKRKKKMTYFWHMSEGADGISNLYKNCFSNSELAKYFEKCKCYSKYATIMLFDNEEKNDKPLKKMLNILKLTDEELAKFKSAFYCQVRGNYKTLYLATIPKFNESENIEIEDLFDNETLSIEIDGRKFSKKDEDIENFYNKDIFSRYIFNNYTKINFDKFRPLLDYINNICFCKNT